MGEVSGIAWTDATFNPWWGCTRVSPGCEHCYAETLATVRRKLDVWGVDAARKPMSEAYWRGPAKWNRKAEAAGGAMRVFCASMADFAEIVPQRNAAARAVIEAARARLFPLIRATPWLTWLLLTKRPENIAMIDPFPDGWPANVWLGTTTEDQAHYDKRWPFLASVPARVRFISHEPALGPLELRGNVAPDWVITGGESGSKARPYDLRWAARVIEECRRVGAAPFVKQLGARAFDEGEPFPTKDNKGAAPAEWPEDLRVQEFPR